MSRISPPLFIGLLGAVMFLAGCQSKAKKVELAYVERPVEVLYNSAAKELDKRRYPDAIALFEEVERQHPYSEWARRSTLMSAFAAYQSRDYDSAIATSQRYIALNPGSEDAAYAYHLVATSYFEQIVDVGRDQRTTELAKASLDELLRRFPSTEYAKDAQLKMDMVNDQLAGKEMEIGRFYLQRNEHLPAINRFRTVVTSYETTTHAPEALYRLVEAYMSVGLEGEALAVAAVLGYNHSETEWYEDAYNIMHLDENGTPDKRKKRFFAGLF